VPPPTRGQRIEEREDGRFSLASTARKWSSEGRNLPKPSTTGLEIAQRTEHQHQQRIEHEEGKQDQQAADP